MAEILVKEYAKKRGVSPVAVTRAMVKGQQLINIIYYRKVGRDWVLTECNKVAKINIGKCVVI